MPLKKEDMDEIVESVSILEKMEPGIFYSIGECSEFLLGGEKIPETRDCIKEYLFKGKEKAIIEKVISDVSLLYSDLAYVQAILRMLGIRGELIMGIKNGKPYFTKNI